MDWGVFPNGNAKMVILTAVDGEEVPSRTVEVADELAEQFEEELVVLHVMAQEVFEEYQDETTDAKPVTVFGTGITYGESRSVPEGTSYTIEDAESHAAGVARDVVERTLERPRNTTYKGRVGNPAQEIVDEATRDEVRYLVIGGRKRSRVGKAIFGSITQSILLTADLPVMTVMRE